jgi:hypothetical protein
VADDNGKFSRAARKVSLGLHKSNLPVKATCNSRRSLRFRVSENAAFQACDEASLIDLLDLMAVWSHRDEAERARADGFYNRRPEGKQRNDMALRGSGKQGGVDLWKGTRDAPIVQRIGAIILALAYLAVVLFFISWTITGGGWLSGLSSLLVLPWG